MDALKYVYENTSNYFQSFRQQLWIFNLKNFRKECQSQSHAT